MKKKYELTNETMTWKQNGKTTVLHRIKAAKDFGNVKAGDLGGWIEKEENLSHKGLSWVSGDSVVKDNAIIKNNAQISGCAVIQENAVICDRAEVYGETVVAGDAVICGSAEIGGTVAAPYIKKGVWDLAGVYYAPEEWFE